MIHVIFTAHDDFIFLYHSSHRFGHVISSKKIMQKKNGLTYCTEYCTTQELQLLNFPFTPRSETSLH